MGVASGSSVVAQRWMPAEELKAMGFAAGGPEIDFGMRWGERRGVRVSFAPYGEHGGGYLYAHDPATDRFLLLAAHTTRIASPQPGAS